MFNTIPVNDSLSLFNLYAAKPITAPIGQRMMGIRIGNPENSPIATTPAKKFMINTINKKGIRTETARRMWLSLMISTPSSLMFIYCRFFFNTPSSGNTPSQVMLSCNGIPIRIIVI